MADQAVQMAEIWVDEIGIQANLDPLEENKEEFKCHECGVRVLYEKSLKRHMRDQHGGKPKMYMKSLKVNGKYISANSARRSILIQEILELTTKSIIFKK